MANQIQSCFRRYEKKYRLTAAQQRFLLEGMAPYMKKDAYGAYTICNIYYDTEDWRLIRTSLEKPVYKEKLRVRSYGVLPEDAFGQIGREIMWFQQFYRARPRVFIAYDRLAFAGTDDPELRITFDTNLRWRDTQLDLRLGDHGAPIGDPDMLLMEIKIPGVCPLWCR